MVTGFTTQFQFWSVLTAVGLFGAAVYLTRATRRRMSGALVAALVFTGLNLPWDLVAHNLRWWRYPRLGSLLLPLPVFFAQDLVWGGALALVSWRIQRRFGPPTLVAFLLLLSAIGGVRDSIISASSGIIVFGPGPVPRLADITCWATLLAIAQVTMRLVAGPSASDSFAQSTSLTRPH